LQNCIPSLLEGICRRGGRGLPTRRRRRRQRTWDKEEEAAATLKKKADSLSSATESH
jgi:hypothetical protein